MGRGSCSFHNARKKKENASHFRSQAAICYSIKFNFQFDCISAERFSTKAWLSHRDALSLKTHAELRNVIAFVIIWVCREAY